MFHAAFISGSRDFMLHFFFSVFKAFNNAPILLDQKDFCFPLISFYPLSTEEEGTEKIQTCLTLLRDSKSVQIS